jgi:hypothetical protein
MLLTKNQEPVGFSIRSTTLAILPTSIAEFRFSQVGQNRYPCSVGKKSSEAGAVALRPAGAKSVPSKGG